MSAAAPEPVELYEGTVRHRRRAPTRHAFTYRVAFLHLDLDRLERLGAWPLFGTDAPALVRFRREDHLGDPERPLAESIRELVGERRGVRPEGPVTLLTQPRAFGLSFNPVSFFYCWDAAWTRPTHLVAEVDNTPWGERHVYVADVALAARGAGAPMAFRVPKRFHVSPFHGMEQTYEWRFTVPGRSLVAHMENWEDGELLTDATLVLRRQRWGAAAKARLLLLYPFGPARVLAGIYREAFRLWRKGTPYHPHPAKLRERTERP